MNILPAKEIKRRGVKAIEIALNNGPVHIIKNNSPACVVLTEDLYATLTAKHLPENKDNTLQWLLQRNSSGNKTRYELDTSLTTERDGWDR